MEHDNICVSVSVCRICFHICSHLICPPGGTSKVQNATHLSAQLLQTAMRVCSSFPSKNQWRLRRSRGADHPRTITSDHWCPLRANSRCRLIAPVWSACGVTASRSNNQIQTAARSHGTKSALSGEGWGGCYWRLSLNKQTACWCCFKVRGNWVEGIGYGLTSQLMIIQTAGGAFCWRAGETAFF